MVQWLSDGLFGFLMLYAFYSSWVALETTSHGHRLAVSTGVARCFVNRLGAARAPHPASPQRSPVPPVGGRLCGLIPVIATLDLLSLLDFLWNLPLGGLASCMSPAGLRLLLHLWIIGFCFVLSVSPTIGV